jgi:hypothetical protein
MGFGKLVLQVDEYGLFHFRLLELSQEIDLVCDQINEVVVSDLHINDACRCVELEAAHNESLTLHIHSFDNCLRIL